MLLPMTTRWFTLILEKKFYVINVCCLVYKCLILKKEERKEFKLDGERIRDCLKVTFAVKKSHDQKHFWEGQGIFALDILSHSPLREAKVETQNK